MNDTSKADADSSFSDIDLDTKIPRGYNEVRKAKWGLFRTVAILVLMVSCIAWKLVKKDMSVYDGTIVLVSFLLVGFFIVLIMLWFVWLRVMQIFDQMIELEDQIRTITYQTLPKNHPDSDVFLGD